MLQKKFVHPVRVICDQSINLLLHQKAYMGFFIDGPSVNADIMPVDFLKGFVCQACKPWMQTLHPQPRGIRPRIDKPAAVKQPAGYFRRKAFAALHRDMVKGREKDPVFKAVTANKANYLFLQARVIYYTVF